MLLMFSTLACSIDWKYVFDRTTESNEAIDGLLGCVFSIILSLSANAGFINVVFIDWDVCQSLVLEHPSQFWSIRECVHACVTANGFKLVRYGLGSGYESCSS